MVPVDYPADKWLKWAYLNGQVNGTFTFTAPAQEGLYEARLYPNWSKKEFNISARSNKITVGLGQKDKSVTTPVIAGKGSRRSIGNPISARNGTDSITLSKRIFEPGEQVNLTFTASPLYPEKSWVGLFKAELPHDGLNANNNHELAFKYLGNKAEGTFVFKAPTHEGQYDFKMFECSNGKEVATIIFKVSKRPGDGG